MKGEIVNWVADHWLIALVVWCLWAAAWIGWARWIMRKVRPVPACDGDCLACETPCAMPMGREDAAGFHLGAEKSDGAAGITTDHTDHTDGKSESVSSVKSVVPAFPKGRWL
jgi:hypothetical protein